MRTLGMRIGAAIEAATLYEREALQRAWLQSLFDAMPEGVIIMDERGKVLQQNRTSLELAVDTGAAGVWATQSRTTSGLRPADPFLSRSSPPTVFYCTERPSLVRSSSSSRPMGAACRFWRAPHRSAPSGPKGGHRGLPGHHHTERAGTAAGGMAGIQRTDLAARLRP